MHFTIVFRNKHAYFSFKYNNTGHKYVMQTYASPSVTLTLLLNIFVLSYEYYQSIFEFYFIHFFIYICLKFNTIIKLFQKYIKKTFIYYTF